MAQQPKLTQDAPKSKSAPRIFVRTTHAPGQMENPFTLEKITNVSSAIVAVDDWTQCQIDAGKLEIVE